MTDMGIMQQNQNKKKQNKTRAYGGRFLSWTYSPLLAISSIAQLVERRIVEYMKLSLGRWFESGSKEIFIIIILFVFTIVFLTRT